MVAKGLGHGGLPDGTVEDNGSTLVLGLLSPHAIRTKLTSTAKRSTGGRSSQ
ncbi:hypothetical protein RB5652 [Rhodopirellula baltica SH 1]|uniref:Uncharacterized protein n=1 Tax=Rhodopirellula baltica (strain DSM 10527 / NCIMB 13988 / SH1) TaxID=243090 RepID=Q7URH8_RHOBA|nr:hypothetical protein RB5652 [Rhodopirellula baltica SH 1]